MVKLEIKRIIDTVTRKKEQIKIMKDLHDTVKIALEAMKYEILEEDTIKQTLKEIAEMTKKASCNIINHPTTTVKELLNTPNIKIQQLQITKTIACKEIKMHDIVEISTTFKAETIEIQTPQKNYIMITNIIEVKAGW